LKSYAEPVTCHSSLAASAITADCADANEQKFGAAAPIEKPAAAR